MGLLKRLLGRGYSSGVPQSTQFHESEPSTGTENSRNAPRRELVHVTLRDTMRRHGIPSDWIECRVLSVTTREAVQGLHVQFVVLQGEDRLLDYVHAFQNGFWAEIERFEPRVRDWLLSVSWQFEGEPAHDVASLPGPGSWTEDQDTLPPEAGDTLPPSAAQHADDLASDLKALYAIRDAAMGQADPGAKAQGKGPIGKG